MLENKFLARYFVGKYYVFGENKYNINNNTGHDCFLENNIKDKKTFLKRKILFRNVKYSDNFLETFFFGKKY